MFVGCGCDDDDDDVDNTIFKITIVMYSSSGNNNYPVEMFCLIKWLQYIACFVFVLMNNIHHVYKNCVCVYRYGIYISIDTFVFSFMQGKIPFNENLWVVLPTRTDNTSKPVVPTLIQHIFIKVYIYTCTCR